MLTVKTRALQRLLIFFLSFLGLKNARSPFCQQRSPAGIYLNTSKKFITNIDTNFRPLAWFLTLSYVCVYFDKNISYCLDREQDRDQHQEPESGECLFATCSLKFKAVIWIEQYFIYSLFLSFQSLRRGRRPGQATRACTWASASCPSPVWVQSFLTVWLPTPGMLVCDMHCDLLRLFKHAAAAFVVSLTSLFQAGQWQCIADCRWKHFQIRVHQTPEEIQQL